ncbi:MAG: choice-of-anchor D domain-containing protein [Steroidobacter sp.]
MDSRPRKEILKYVCMLWLVLASTQVMAASVPSDVFVPKAARPNPPARIEAASIPSVVDATIVLDSIDINVQAQPFSNGIVFAEIRDATGAMVLGTGQASWASAETKTLSFHLRERPVLTTGTRYRVYVQRSAGIGAIRWLGSCPAPTTLDDYPFGRSSSSNANVDLALRTFRFAGEGVVREDQFMLQSVRRCDDGAQPGVELDATGQQFAWQEFTAGEQRVALTSASLLIERNWTAPGPVALIALYRDGDTPDVDPRVALSDPVAVSPEEVPEWHEVLFASDRPLLGRGERYRMYPGVLFLGINFPFDQTTWYTRAPTATDYAGGESSQPDTDFFFQVSLNGSASEPPRIAEAAGVARGVLHNFPQEWQSFTVRSEERHDAPDIGVVGLPPGNTSSFGEVFATDVRTQTYSIINAGTAPLTGVRISLSGEQSQDFEISKHPDLTVAPGRGTTFQIRFIPTSVGVRTARLMLASNDPDTGRYMLNLTGTGVPVTGPNLFVQALGRILRPDGHFDFGSVFPGNSSSIDFTIVNNGTATLNVTSAAVVSGANFSVTRAPAATIAPGGSTSFTVTFSSGGGDVSGLLRIVSNDPNPSTYHLTLSGTSFD